MTRDQALAIADRIMARFEIDKAIHRDAIANEVIAAMALLKEQAFNRQNLAPQAENCAIGVPSPMVAGPGIPAIGFKSHGVEGVNNVAIGLMSHSAAPQTDNLVVRSVPENVSIGPDGGTSAALLLPATSGQNVAPPESRAITGGLVLFGGSYHYWSGSGWVKLPD